MLIEIVCMNLNRRDTLQQPVATYRPACRANQKAETKRIHQCTYTVQQCLYISGNEQSHLYTAHQLYRPACTSLYMVCTCLWNSKLVHKCTNVYIHVWTMYIHVYTGIFMNAYIQCTYMFINIPKCMYVFIHFECSYISRNVWTCLYSVYDTYIL